MVPLLQSITTVLAFAALWLLLRAGKTPAAVETYQHQAAWVMWLNLVLCSFLLVSITCIYIFQKNVHLFREPGLPADVADRYHHMIEEVEDYAILFLDTNGIIKSWNKGAEKIKGYQAAEIIGKNFRVFYTPEDQASRLPEKLIAGAVQYGKAQHEGWRVRKDNSRFWGSIVITAIHNNKNQVTGFTKVTRDLTATKKSEDKFRSLLDAAPDATVIVNEAGIIEMINNQTVQLFGYTRNELVGKPVETLIPEEMAGQHRRHRASFATAAASRTMGAGIELHAVRKNGTRFPVEISLSPLHTEDGVLVSAAVREITERKKLENELKQSYAEMEAFTYSVSHDLRAPLRGIIGFTSILEQEYAASLDEEAKRIAAIIRSNTQKMGDLIDALLDFSRMHRHELQKTTIDTNRLVKEILNDMNMPHPPLEIDWQIQNLLPVNADRNTMKQVWVNIISNAIKYSSRKPSPKIEIASYREGDHLVFYVKDNGVGFNEKYSHKLFKVFQRLHSAEAFEGTGVGLALVEKIVSRHGGKVWAKGRENEGACFYFSLPA